MTIRDLVTIALRLFSVYWVYQGVIYVAGTVIAIVSGHYWQLWSGFLEIALAVAVWGLAPRLSAAATGGMGDGTILGQIHRADLFVATVMGVGLFTALSEFANLFNWVHFFASSSEDTITVEQAYGENYYYELSYSGLKTIAGVLVAVYSRPVANKILQLDAKRLAGSSGGKNDH